MTACGDGQEESRARSASLITPKTTLRVGCLNISTFFQVGKTANVMKEFRKYKLEILRLTTMRWTGFEKLRRSTGEYILYSRSEEDYHRGVGLALKKK